MTKKVFVLSNGGHDYTDAERFGEIVICTDGAVDKWDTAQMYRELVGPMHDAKPGDYILISSLATLCCVATALMVELTGEVHFLLYKGGQYIERSLILDN